MLNLLFGFKLLIKNDDFFFFNNRFSFKVKDFSCVNLLRPRTWNQSLPCFWPLKGLLPKLIGIFFGPCDHHGAKQKSHILK